MGGDTQMPGANSTDSFTFTFNTWGFGPSLYGEIDEDDYTKQSIYALLYSTYAFAGDTQMPGAKTVMRWSPTCDAYVRSLFYNFCRQPGTDLYETMVNGTDSYLQICNVLTDK